MIGVFVWLRVGGRFAGPSTVRDAGGERRRTALTQDASAQLLSAPTAAAAADARVRGAPEPVTEFLGFAASRRGHWAATTVRDDTAEGIRQLALALDRVAARRHADRMELQPIVDDLRIRSDALRHAHSPTTQARLAHESFVTAGGLMQALRSRGYPVAARSVDDARDAALGLSPREPLARQIGTVEAFFERATHVVRQLSRETSR